jgi:transposase
MPALLPAEKQTQILELIRERKTNKTIHNITKVSEKTIANIRKRNRRKLKRTIRLPLGRRTVRTAALHGRIERALGRTRIKDAGELKRVLRSPHCENTLRKALHDVGATYSAPKRNRFLKAEHREKRTDFSKKMMTTICDFKNFLYVDEKKFKLDGPDGQLKVWHIPGKSVCLPYKSQNYRASVMVFAGIMMGWKTPLYFIEDTMKGVDYASLIERVYDDFVQANPDRKLYLYQDNASIHKADCVMEKLAELGIETVKPPANSPDLNPIENGWTEFSRRLFENSPSFQTVNDAKNMMVEVWEDLPIDYVNTLCSSVPKRIFEVYEAAGSTIKY